MKKSNNFKALYNFAKKQKMKDSTSTKDLDDSLEQIHNCAQSIVKHNDKKIHHRTQSCPSITEPLKFTSNPPAKIDKTQRSELDGSAKSELKKPKISHRHCHSQASIDSVSKSQQSVSI